MSELNKYILTFPVTPVKLDSDELTFSIGNIKSREPSVVFFKFYGYDIHNNLIETYTGDRWVILDHYQEHYETWNLSVEYEEIDHYYIELYLIGINSENPLYFNHLMLTDKEYEAGEWHQPNDVINDVKIGFKNNIFVNLYDLSDNYLQIIRPNKEDLTTSQLLPSQTTILAPHLENESEWDNPVKVFYEYMYQIEQRIGVEK